MTLDQLFLRTIDDLRLAADSPDEYVLLKSSGLLRQLVLDGSPLIDVVNRQRRLKLRYTVVDLTSNTLAEVTLSLNPTTYLHGDALHSSFAFPNMRTVSVRLQDLLAVPVGIYNAEPFTVADVIKHCANVLGGVHIGTEAPAGDADVERMRQLRITIVGMRPLVFQLRSIIKIVLDGVAPLEQMARTNPLGDSV